MAQESRAEDKRTLIEILINIEKQLHFIISERKVDGRPLFRREFAAFLLEPGDQVATYFRRSQEMIEQDKIDWEYVEGLGMAGRMLKWKKRFFDETLRQGVLSRFFKVSNSILGSLAKAIPPLEAVKEYKEHVEAAMRYPNR
jgi:hypothetical protein